MSAQVLTAMLIESALVSGTTLLLAQPGFVFRAGLERTRSRARDLGLIFLCITFCWSVIFGMVLALSSLTIKL